MQLTSEDMAIIQFWNARGNTPCGRTVRHDSRDAALIALALDSETQLLTAPEYRTWLAFGKDCLDANGVVRIEQV